MKTFKQWLEEEYNMTWEYFDNNISDPEAYYEEYEKDLGIYEEPEDDNFDLDDVTCNDTIVKMSENRDGSEGEQYIACLDNKIEIYRNGELLDYRKLDYDEMNFIDNLVDEFENDGNFLEEVNGELFEILEIGVYKLMREAKRI